MNQKASNKYLFDQVVDCHNCFHYLGHNKNGLSGCKLNPHPSGSGYYIISYVRSDKCEQPLILKFSCGPTTRNIL